MIITRNKSYKDSNRKLEKDGTTKRLIFGTKNIVKLGSGNCRKHNSKIKLSNKIRKTREQTWVVDACKKCVFRFSL